MHTPKLFFFRFLLTATATLLTTQLGRCQYQKGADINGESAYDGSGYSVSMPDANTVAIGARLNGGNGPQSGHVRIFQWTGTTWNQKGADINGESSYDLSGFSVSMPDANTVAIGAPENDGNGSNSGHVRIFEWNGSAWTQKGLDIDGESSGDQCGYTVSMPDANTVAIGAPLNGGNGSLSGHARIFEWNGSTWMQKGADIDGEAANDWSGFSVSMPDANTVAVGAIWNDVNGGSSANFGHVRVYTWNGSAWLQKGDDMNGEFAGDQFGQSVSMPDANTIAVGAPYNDGSGSDSGHARVYTWNGSSWNQMGSDINGDATVDNAGVSVSMPNATTLAVGIPGHDGSFGDAGQVRMYSWNGSNWNQLGTNINGEGPQNYSGKAISMPNANTIAIGATGNDAGDLDVGHVRVYSLCANTASTISPIACTSYTSPSGMYTWTVSGVYTDVIPNASGCDSLITINLTIGIPEAPSGNALQHFCASATVSDLFAVGDNIQWYSSAAGGSPLAVSTLLMNGTTYYASQIVAGCESLDRLAVLATIGSTSTSTQTMVECGSYTWPLTGLTYTTSTNDAVTLVSSTGCDSIVSLQLTILNTSFSTDVITACDYYIWIDGNTYINSNNTATFTVPNSAGCDSVITLDLEIVFTPLAQAGLSGNQLICPPNDLFTYQWINCDNANSPITGANSTSYTPSVNGNYAVIVSNGACSDTSDCVLVNNVGMREYSMFDISIFPNPSDDIFTIDLGKSGGAAYLTITDIHGRVVLKDQRLSTQRTDIEIDLPAGTYLVHVTSNGYTEIVRLNRK